MLYLDHYRPADPPKPTARDIRRMAVDAVGDGLPLAMVARLFDLDCFALKRAVAAAAGRTSHQSPVGGGSPPAVAPKPRDFAGPGSRTAPC